MAQRRHRRLAWAGALAVTGFVHLGLLVFLVEDRGATRAYQDLSAVEVELSPPPRRPQPPPPRAHDRRAEPAAAAPPSIAPHQPPPHPSFQPSPVQPFAVGPVAPTPAAPAPAAPPGIATSTDPCAPARRAALSAWQRERCDRRGRDYVDFDTGQKAPKFEQQVRDGYIKPDLPYLARKPVEGCKPYAAPIAATGGGDEVMAGVACAHRF